MSVINFEIDNYITMDVYKDENGNLKPVVYKVVYLGSADSPFSEEEITVDDLLQEFINNNSIPGFPSHSLKKEYYDTISQGLDAFAKAIEAAKKKLEAMPYWKSEK